MSRLAEPGQSTILTMAYTPGPRPCLQLQTLDRGNGLLGLRPCGPVKPPARSPL